MNAATPETLRRRGLTLEYLTLACNVVGTGVVLAAALNAASVALVGFGLDSLLEIGASTVVIWQLGELAGGRERRALRLIGGAFIATAAYITTQAAYTFAIGDHLRHSTLGIAWTAVTCLVMLALAAGKTAPVER